METLLTLEEAARFLRIHIDTMRRYVREGRIAAAKIGRGYRIRPADLETFLNELQQE